MIVIFGKIFHNICFNNTTQWVISVIGFSKVQSYLLQISSWKFWDWLIHKQNRCFWWNSICLKIQTIESTWSKNETKNIFFYFNVVRQQYLKTTCFWSTSRAEHISRTYFLRTVIISMNWFAIYDLSHWLLKIYKLLHKNEFFNFSFNEIHSICMIRSFKHSFSFVFFMC